MLRQRSLVGFINFLVFSLILAACSGPQPAPSAFSETPALHASEASAATAVPATPSLAPALPAQPTPLLAAVDPHKWIWAFNETDQSVLRINPATNSIEGRLKVKARPVELALGEGSVWAIEQGWKARSFILRIDPASLEVTQRIQIDQGNAVSLAAGAGAVWVGIEEFETDASPVGPAGGLLRIDPIRNEISSYTSLGAIPIQLSVVDGSLWALEWNNITTTLNRINPYSGEQLSLPLQVDSAAALYQFARFTLSPSGIWATSMDPRSRYIYKVDRANGKILQIVAAGPNPDDNPVDIAAQGDSIWAALFSGKVVQIDPGSGEVKSISEVRGPLTHISIANGDIWAENRLEAELFGIDPESLEITANITTGSRLAATATPAPHRKTADECKPARPTRLKVGGRAIVKGEPPLPNRVRSDAGKQGRYLGEIVPGGTMVLLEGPVCVDNWLWWKVQVDKNDLIGWTAEGDDTIYWLAPVQ